MSLIIKREGTIVTWTIKAPDKNNALDLQLGQEMLTHLKLLHQQCQKIDISPSELEVLIIQASRQGTASGSWISGGDLKEHAVNAKKEYAREFTKTYQNICRGLETLPVPVLMCIDGAAIGGGAEFAMAGDLRFATKDSSLHFKQLELGLTTGFGGTGRLRRLIGLAHAQNILLQRERVGSEQALCLGLFSKVFDNSKAMLQAAHVAAKQLQGLNANAVRWQKALLKDDLNADEQIEVFSSLWHNPEHKLKLEQFLAKKDT